MMKIQILLGVVLVAGMTPPSIARAATAVYTVDLQKAVLATADGRKVKATLERLRRAEEQKIRASEATLENDKAKLSPAGYRARFRDIQTQIEASGARLETEQDRLLAPILARFRTLIDNAQGDKVVVLDVSVEAPIGLDARCDRTTRLVKAYAAKAGGSVDLGPPTDACRAEGFLFVHFDRVINELPESRAALARLDALQEKRQADIELRKRRVQELHAKAQGDPKWRQEAVARAKQLDETFRAYQQELRDAEAKTQSTLYERVERSLVRFSQRHKRYVFVEYFDESPAVQRPKSCEVSAWTVRLVRGQADQPALKKLCPWMS